MPVVDCAKGGMQLFSSSSKGHYNCVIGIGVSEFDY
jgi:hypothetical protein